VKICVICGIKKANANFKPMPANTTTIKIPLKIIT